MKTEEAGVVDHEGRSVKVTDAQPIETVTPIIVDAGRRSRKAIRRLKEGRGTLMDEVGDIVADVRSSRGGAGKEIVPVVIIYRRRIRSRARVSLPLIPSPFDLLR